jgi:hypothetical protein
LKFNFDIVIGQVGILSFDSNPKITNLITKLDSLQLQLNSSPKKS